MSWCFDPGAEITPQHRAIALLGDGIRTETWLAWDTLRWAPVVVKIARPDHVASSSTIDALRREAHAHAMITHPLVRQLFDDQTEAAAPHLVLEYVQGPALADLVVDRAVHPVDVIRLGLQIASVLRYFHACGLVHLDVKPGNAVLRAGHSVLIDLGFTRPMGWTALDGIPRGSRPYMAPEQCRCEPRTPATDLFGLGATLLRARDDGTAVLVPGRRRATGSPCDGTERVGRCASRRRRRLDRGAACARTGRSSVEHRRRAPCARRRAA